MTGMIIYLFGVPLLLFASQLILSLRAKSLFVRLFPAIIVGVTLIAALLITFWVGMDIPGAYLNIVLPRAIAVATAWLIYGFIHFIRKRTAKNNCRM